MRHRRGDHRSNLLDRDSFVFGLVIGVATPVVAYGILLVIYDFLEQQLLATDIGFAPDFRTRTLMLIGICLNLVPFHLYQRRHADATMRGMVLPTVIYVGLWFWFFGRQLVGL